MSEKQLRRPPPINPDPRLIDRIEEADKVVISREKMDSHAPSSWQLRKWWQFWR